MNRTGKYYTGQNQSAKIRLAAYLIVEHLTLYT